VIIIELQKEQNENWLMGDN